MPPRVQSRPGSSGPRPCSLEDCDRAARRACACRRRRRAARSRRAPSRWSARRNARTTGCRALRSMKTNRPASFSLRCTVTKSNSRAESRARRRRAPACSAYSSRRSSMKRAIELLVAVGEERDQIVDARTEQRVLKVDPGELDGLPVRRRNDHQVAALVVAMDEAARPGGDRARQPLGDLARRRLGPRPRSGMPRASMPHSRK